MPDRQLKYTVRVETDGKPALDKLTDATSALGDKAEKATKDFQNLDGVVTRVSRPAGDFGKANLDALPVGLTKANAAVDPLIAKFRQTQGEIAKAQQHIDSLTQSQLTGTQKVAADHANALASYGKTDQQRSQIDKLFAPQYDAVRQAEQKELQAHSLFIDHMVEQELKGSKRVQAEHRRVLAEHGKTVEDRRRIDEFFGKKEEEARHEEHRSFTEKIQSGTEDIVQHPFNAAGRALAAGAEAIGPLGTTLVVGAGAAALAIAELAKHTFELVNAEGEAAEQTEHLGIRLGLTSHEASALSAEARIVGVDVNTLAGGARYLSEALEDASGTGQKTAKALSQLGIQSLDPITGKAREMGKVFEDVLEKLSTVQDTNKRTFLAEQIFPRGAAKELLPLIDSYKRAKEELADIGGGQPDELIKTLADGEEQIHKMGVAYDFFKARLAEKLEPIVIHFVGDFTKLLSDGKHHVPAAIATSLFGPFAGDILEPVVNAAVNGAPKPVGPEPPPGYTEQQKADFERGKQIATRANNRFLNNTSQGLHFQLAQQEKDLQEAQSAVTAATSQGISTHAVDELVGKRDNLARVVESLKKRAKALDEAPQIIQEYNRKVEETREKLFQLQHPASRFGDLPRILNEQDLFNFNLVNDEKTKGNRPLQRRYQSLEQPLFRAELQAGAEAEGLKFHERQNQLATIEDKGNLDALKRSFDLQEKLAKLQSSPDDPVRGIELVNQAYQHQLEISEKLYEADAHRAVQYVPAKDPKFAQLIAEINTAKTERDDQALNENIYGREDIQKQTRDRAERADKEIARLRSEAGLDALNRQFSVQQHLASLANEGIETPDTVTHGLDAQLAIAKSVYDQHLKDNADALKGDDLRVANERAYQDLTKQTDEARLDAVHKFLDLQQQGISQAKQSAGELFNALRTDPLGPGHGASEFFKAQGNKILENLFANAAAPIFKSVGQVLNQSVPQSGPLAGLFKNIFHGTAFEDPTNATKENTNALKRLTDTLLGKSDVAPSGIPGVSTIPGEPADEPPGGIKSFFHGLFHPNSYNGPELGVENLPYRIPDANTLPNLNDVPAEPIADLLLPSLDKSHSRLDAIHTTLSQHLANSLNQIKPLPTEEDEHPSGPDPIVTELRRVQKTIEVGTPDGSTPQKSPNGFAVAGDIAALVPPIRPEQPGQDQTLASDAAAAARVVVPRIAVGLEHAAATANGYGPNSPLAIAAAAKRYLIDIPVDESAQAGSALSRGQYREAAQHELRAIPGASILPDFLSNQGALGDRAKQDFATGHPLAGTLHKLAEFIPGEGPELSKIYDHYQEAKRTNDPLKLDEVVGEAAGVATDIGYGAFAGEFRAPHIPSKAEFLKPTEPLGHVALDQLKDNLSSSFFLDFLHGQEGEFETSLEHPPHPAARVLQKTIRHSVSAAQKKGLATKSLAPVVGVAEEQTDNGKPTHPASLAPRSELISPHGFDVAGEVAALDSTPALELLAGAVDHKAAVVREGLGAERFTPPSLGLKLKGDLPKPPATPRTVATKLVDSFLAVDDLPSVLPLVPRYLHDIPVEQYGKAKDAFSKGQNAKGVAQLIGGIPGSGVIADILEGQYNAFQRSVKEFKQAPQAQGALGKFGAYTNAIGDAMLSPVPLIGPNAIATTDDLISGDPDRIAEGTGHALGYVVSDLAPFLGAKAFLQEAKLHPVVSAAAEAASQAKAQLIERAKQVPAQATQIPAQVAEAAARTKAQVVEQARQVVEHLAPPETRAIRAAETGKQQPVASSPFTGTPIYTYKGSRGPLASGITGFLHPETGKLFLNERLPQERLGATLKHESAHDVLHPYIDSIAQSRPAPDLEPKVQAALAARSQLYYGSGHPTQIYNEGFAYGIETGRVPGLDVPESGRFIESILSEADKQGHPAVREQTQQLYAAQPAELARLIPTQPSLRDRFVAHLRDSNLLDHLKDETGSFGPGSGRPQNPAFFPNIPVQDLFTGDAHGAPPAIHSGLADEPPLPPEMKSWYAPLFDEPASEEHAHLLHRQATELPPAKSAFGRFRRNIAQLDTTFSDVGTDAEGNFISHGKRITSAVFDALMDETGSFGPGSGRKRERAVASYKPATRAKQRIADQTEAEASAALGIPRTSGNAPFDLQNNKFGIEVKTLVDNDNDKITMHKESLDRKLHAADENQLHPYTLAVDKRGESPAYYYREGLGSFRLASRDTKRVPSLQAFKNILMDETGSFGPGSGLPSLFRSPEQAFQFYSPNEAEHLSFDQAKQNLASPEQQRMFSVGARLDKLVGLKAKQSSAIGDWSDGAENSILDVVKKAPSLEALRYTAAIKGDLANQKSVIPFLAKEGGPDSVYQIQVPKADPAAVRSSLDEHGIQFRTLVPEKSGTKIVVFDPGSTLGPKVDAFAKAHGTEAQQTRGIGEFLGGETREEGHAAYQQVIRDYEAKTGTSLYDRAIHDTLPQPPSFVDRVTPHANYQEFATPDNMVGWLAAHLPALPINPAIGPGIGVQDAKSPEATDKNTQALSDLTAAILKANSAATGTAATGGFVPTAPSPAVDRIIQGSLPSAPAYNAPGTAIATDEPTTPHEQPASRNVQTSKDLNVVSHAIPGFIPGAAAIQGGLGAIQSVLGAFRQFHNERQQHALQKAIEHAQDSQVSNDSETPGVSPSGFPVAGQVSSLDDNAALGLLANYNNAGSSTPAPSNAYSDASTLAPGLYDLPQAPAFQEGTAPLDVSDSGVPTYTSQASAFDSSTLAPSALAQLLTASDSSDTSSTVTHGEPTFSANAYDTSQDLPQGGSLGPNGLDKTMGVIGKVQSLGKQLSSVLGGGASGGNGSFGVGADDSLDEPNKEPGFFDNLGFGLGGKTQDGGNALFEPFTGGQNADGSDMSGTERAGMGIGAFARIGTGAYAISKQLQSGGVKGDLGAVGTGLETIAPFTGPAAPFVMAAGLLTSFISSFFRSGREERSRQISRELETARVAAEPYTQNGVNIEATTSGHLAVDNFLGNVTDTKLHPDIYKINQAIGFDPLHPDRVITQPYRVVGGVYTGGSAPAPYGYDNDLTNPLPKVPGAGSLSDLSPSLTQSVNQPSTTNIIINNHLPVHGIDSKDIISRANDFADALSVALQSQHRVAADIRFITNPV